MPKKSTRNQAKQGKICKKLLEYEKKKNPVTLMKLAKAGIGNSQKVNDMVYKIIIARSKQKTLGHIKYNSDEMKEVLSRGIYDKYRMQ